MRRRIIRWCLIGIVLLPLTGLALVFGYAQTGFGKRLLASLIGDLASQPGMTISVTGISGFVPVDIAIDQVTIADAGGTWLTLENAALGWSPLALIGGTAAIDTLSAERLTLHRLPEAGVDPEPPPEQESTALLPELPLAVRLDRLVIEELALDEAVLGDPVDLRVALSATLGPPSEGLFVDAEILRTDTTPGRLTLNASYIPESQRLSVDLTAEEPAGGLLVRTIDLPDLPAISIRVQGDGATDDWTGTMALEAGPSLQVAGDLRLAVTGDRTRFGTDLEAIIDGLVPADLGGLVDGGIRLGTDATLADEVVSLDRFQLEAAAGRIGLDGHVDPTDSTGTLRFRIDPTATAWAPFLPDLDMADLSITGTAGGPIASPAVQIDLQASGITFDEIAADAATVTVTRADASSGLDHRIDGRIDLIGLTLAGSPLPALGPDPDIDLALDLAEDGRLDLDRLAVDGRSVFVSATGAAEGWGNSATANVQATVASLAAIPDLAELGLGGAMVVDIAVDRDERGVDAVLDARWSDPVTGVPQADAALGDVLTLASRLSLSTDGPVTLSDLVIDAGALSLAADGVLDGQELAAIATVSMADLGTVLEGAAGALAIEADAYGTLDSLAVDLRASLATARLAGIDVPELRLTASASDLPAAPQARIGLTGTVAGLPVSLDTEVAMDVEGGIVAELLRLTAGSAEVSGGLTATTDGLVIGSLDGQAASLAAFSGLLGQPISGSLGFGLTLTAPDGTQDAELRVDLANLGVGETMVADRVGLAATAADLTGEPRLGGRLEASGIQTEGSTIETASVEASGPLADLALSLELAGTVAELETLLTAQARLALAESTRIDLTTLSADIDDVTIGTTQPATIRLAPAGPTLEGLRLAVDDGRIALDASFDPVLRAALEVTDLPLSLTRLFVPDLISGGRLNGRVELDASPAAPRAGVALTATGVLPAALATSGLGGIDAEFAGRLAGGLFQLDGGIVGAAGAIDITGSVPLVVDGGLLLPPDAPELAASVRGQLDLTPFTAMLSGADQLAGTLDLDLAVAGPADSLGGEGEIRLSGASYANPIVGIAFEGINATLSGTTGSLRLTELEVRTPNGGRMTGEGSIELDALAGFPATLRLTADDAQIVDRAEATVVIDADLDLSGPVLDAPALSGSVRIDSAELRIPESLPPAFPVIPVTEINLPPELAALRPPPETGFSGGSGTAVDPTLDIRIEAPGRIFVRGRGAELELAADMRVLGRGSAPRIEGGLSLRTGTLDLLGNTLTFSRADVGFFGDGSLTPQLDVLATAPLDEIVATVAVTGTADDPDLRFSSEPELPEDEVLARLLFGKASGALSPFEAIQLADSIATLTGVGGPSVLDRVRGSIGIDRLSVGEDEEGGATVSVGTRITDDVLVTVEQGIGPGSGRVGVEVELTDNIILETDAGADASGRAGIRFQWEY